MGFERLTGPTGQTLDFDDYIVSFFMLVVSNVLKRNEGQVRGNPS